MMSCVAMHRNDAKTIRELFREFHYQSGSDKQPHLVVIVTIHTNYRCYFIL